MGELFPQFRDFLRNHGLTVRLIPVQFMVVVVILLRFVVVLERDYKGGGIMSSEAHRKQISYADLFKIKFNPDDLCGAGSTGTYLMACCHAMGERQAHPSWGQD